jgi:hypothetical protein
MNLNETKLIPELPIKDLDEKSKDDYEIECIIQ